MQRRSAELIALGGRGEAPSSTWDLALDFHEGGIGGGGGAGAGGGVSRPESSSDGLVIGSSDATSAYSTHNPWRSLRWGL
jgi:hypothetical protein